MSQSKSDQRWTTYFGVQCRAARTSELHSCTNIQVYASTLHTHTPSVAFLQRNERFYLTTGYDQRPHVTHHNIVCIPLTTLKRPTFAAECFAPNSTKPAPLVVDGTECSAEAGCFFIIQNNPPSLPFRAWPSSNLADALLLLRHRDPSLRPK